MTDRDPAVRAALADCAAIAERNDSTLFHATRLLPRFRQDLFAGAYAAMRVIDDAVDEDFLVRPEQDRHAGRAAMAATVEAWRRQTAEGAIDGPLSSSVALGFQATVGCSDLGPEPWNGLAAAMTEDVAEADMPDWEAFDRYADGATVAPATVFIYLLACRFSDGHYRCDLPERPRYYASDLAVFCYLVHILRDLAKDAGSRGRLVTIPRTVLAGFGLDRDTLADALATGDHAKVDRLADVLLNRADLHRSRGRERLTELMPHLDLREKVALEGLVRVYEGLHNDFRQRYAARLAGLPDLEAGHRVAAFDRS